MIRRSAVVVTVAALLLAGIFPGTTVEPSTAAPGKLRPTRITVKASAERVVVLEPVTLTGRVSGPERRVELELLDALEWQRVDHTRTDELGHYSFAAPTRWYGKKRLRVVAPATKDREAASIRVNVRVVPEYVPIGNPKSWKNNGDELRRYNPCEPVPYAVNPSRLPADGMAVLNEAIFRVEKASGLRYRYLGTTNAIPFRTTAGPDRDRAANLVVAWSAPETDSSNLADGVLGVAGTLRSRWISSQRTYLLKRTGILLDAGETWTYRGFENGSSLGVTHMHLLGVALGLGQVEATTQVMNKYARAESPAQFGNGDLTGLAKHGRDAGCLPASDRQGASGRVISRPVGAAVARR